MEIFNRMAQICFVGVENSTIWKAFGIDMRCWQQSEIWRSLIGRFSNRERTVMHAAYAGGIEYQQYTCIHCSRIGILWVNWHCILASLLVYRHIHMCWELKWKDFFFCLFIVFQYLFNWADMMLSWLMKIIRSKCVESSNSNEPSNNHTVSVLKYKIFVIRWR